MLDKQFDKIINQKLKNIKLDVPESDWNVFSQKLRVAMESTGPEDQLFDEAVKSKIADANIDIPKPEWSTFAAKLNADTGDLSDADFDATIKEKLENPDIEIPKADWPVFAAILAGNAESTDISDDSFDNAIQDKLQNNSMDIPSPNWNAFSQKLQEASLTDQEMDSEMKSKLENYATPYNESHWAILRDKMIETRHLRRNLYGLKWFEAALAILLFMTFSNFIADRFIPESPKVFAETSEAVSSTNTTGVIGANSSNAIENNTTINNAVNPSREGSSAQVAEANTSSATDATASAAVPSTLTEGLGSINKEEASNSTNNQVALVNNSYNNKEVLTSDNGDITVDNDSNDHTSTKTADITSKASNGTANLATATNELSIVFPSIDLLSPNLFNKTRDFKDMNLAFSPFERTMETPSENCWAIHAIIGNNNHLISTPQDTFVFELPYEHSSKNLNFDLRISKEFKQVELMTGIAYQRMQYGSRVTETDVEFEGELGDFMISSIKYDLIKIPMTARWNYTVNDKFSFFADLGISANILARSEYKQVHTAYESSNPDIPKPQPTEQLEEEFAGIENSSLNLKNYQKGIFSGDGQGASLKESLYGTLDTGIGLNYQFSKRFETYARGSVNQALGQFQIGPNHDTFTTFGVQLGLKYNLLK